MPQGARNAAGRGGMPQTGKSCESRGSVRHQGHSVAGSGHPLHFTGPTPRHSRETAKALSFPYRRGLGGAPVQWASNGDANGGGDIERLTRDYSRYLDDVIDSHGGQQNAEGAKRFMKPLDKWLAEKTGA